MNPMFLTPVFPIYELSDTRPDLVEMYENVVELVVDEGIDIEAQDYIEWPLELVSIKSDDLTEKELEDYEILTDYISDLMEAFCISPEETGFILVQNYWRILLNTN